MRGSAMLIQWEEEEKSGYENSKKNKSFFTEKKGMSLSYGPLIWQNMMNDVSERQKTKQKIHRNMPQYGVKGGKMGKKQQKRPSRNYLRISQAIHVMKLNCFLTEFVRTYLNLKLEKKKRFFFSILKMA